jgi:hypothetical protein
VSGIGKIYSLNIIRAVMQDSGGNKWGFDSSEIKAKNLSV